MSLFTSDVIVDNTVTVDGSGVIQPVSGPLTDTQLRATPVPVSGTVTATGPLTDTQLRATAVPVSGPLTDTQLRATPVPVTSTPQTNASATVAQVVLTANTSAQALAANANRIKAIFFIPTQPAYIKFGATASTTSFTYKITANSSTVEIPTGYTGRIDVLSQNGQTINVTEY